MGDERISMSLSSATQASTQHSTAIETGIGDETKVSKGNGIVAPDTSVDV